MSDLDESLSDVTPKKKFPFELEKAIHNIMFIKHHIQRQDEYNAVSNLIWRIYEPFRYGRYARKNAHR